MEILKPKINGKAELNLFVSKRPYENCTPVIFVCVSQYDALYFSWWNTYINGKRIDNCHDSIIIFAIPAGVGITLPSAFGHMSFFLNLNDFSSPDEFERVNTVAFSAKMSRFTLFSIVFKLIYQNKWMNNERTIAVSSSVYAYNPCGLSHLPIFLLWHLSCTCTCSINFGSVWMFTGMKEAQNQKIPLYEHLILSCIKMVASHSIRLILCIGSVHI